MTLDRSELMDKIVEILDNHIDWYVIGPVSDGPIYIEGIEESAEEIVTLIEDMYGIL
jgi:hypothetical protein